MKNFSYLRRKTKKRLNRSFGGDIGVIILLSAFGVFMAAPMIYAICQALKPLDELWMFPPRFFVRNPTLKNFRDVFVLMSNSWVPFLRYVYNTTLIAGVGTFGHVIIASLCAFALSKFKFPGSDFMMGMVVLSLMFSTSVTVIPNFIIMSKIGWVDNLASIIVPAFGSSLGLYLMKQFMDQIVPDSILESSKIDGSSDWHTFWVIVMPMVKPAWLTLTIFSFQALWNQGANLFIYSEELKTLNTALSQILAGGIARSGAGSAAAVLMMIPPILVFVLLQSKVIETMSTSGMKD
jgi:ABC-type glycerol-3-phosphate transport system permease component